MYKRKEKCLKGKLFEKLKFWKIGLDWIFFGILEFHGEF